MDRAELRVWIEDALNRHERDVHERGETLVGPTAAEIVDAVWGRLPLHVRRITARSDVQASLAMLSLRHDMARRRSDSVQPRRMPRGQGSGDHGQ
jgi:hypothetical protein